jgi:hypothetical protein
MGGSIGVTIREENGTIHKMCRWTNSLPDFFRSIKFITKDKEHLKEYLKVWQEMVTEYNEAKKGDKPLPKITMVDVYAPFPYFAPMNYGLVVIDYMNNKVLHSQCYSSFVSNIHKSSIKEDFRDAEYKDIWMQLCKENKLVLVETFNYVTQKEQEINEEINFEGLQTIIDSKDRNQDYIFKIKTEPWEFVRFKENREEAEKFKSELEQLGFWFTHKENIIWERWIKKFNQTKKNKLKNK